MSHVANLKSKISHGLCLFLVLLIVNACKEIDPKDCTQAVCSEQFNSIYMQVVDTLNQPVALDTFKLVNMLDKSALKLNFTNEDFKQMQATGRYLISDDNIVPNFRNTQMVVEFTGIMQEKEVAKGAATIDIDCCHVSLYYGNLTIVLSKP